jgi:hypothetical protein
MRYALLFTIFLVGACGSSDKGPPDAKATPDTAGPTIDAAPQADDCMKYCQCMPVNCPGFFPDDATCMTTCMALAPADQACRRYHCSVAVGADATMHCPHAEGMAICH